MTVSILPYQKIGSSKIIELEIRTSDWNKQEHPSIKSKEELKKVINSLMDYLCEEWIGEGETRR